MTTPQLLSYVRDQSAAGVPPAAIRRSLLLNEWSERDIDEAFAKTAPSSVTQKTPAVRVAVPSFTGRKLALSLGFIAISAAYAAWQSIGGTVQNPIATATPAQTYKRANDALLQTLAQIQNTVPSSTPVSAPAPAPTQSTAATPSKPAAPAPTPAPVKPAGQYANGSYTGSAADAYYGTVQVQAVVTNGQLADVQFLQYPSDRSTSRYINSQAMPMLTQEAIQAQSANVSGVSGATDTSMAFVQSLTSALTQAKN